MAQNVVHWKNILSGIDSNSSLLNLSDSLSSALRNELQVLSATGSTDAALNTAILSTYGPIIASITEIRCHVEREYNRMEASSKVTQVLAQQAALR